MNQNTHVTISEMSASECRAFLKRHHLGRVAYSLHDRIDIQPISYACEAEWILLRTSEGSKVEKLRHHPWVAFQVDEIRGHYDWESVVVHGSVQHLSDTGTPMERDAYASAISALRTVDPNAFSHADLVPHRDLVLRIYIDSVTGRHASTESASIMH